MATGGGGRRAQLLRLRPACRRMAALRSAEAGRCRGDARGPWPDVQQSAGTGRERRTARGLTGGHTCGRQDSSRSQLAVTASSSRSSNSCLRSGHRDRRGHVASWRGAAAAHSRASGCGTPPRAPGWAQQASPKHTARPRLSTLSIVKLALWCSRSEANSCAGAAPPLPPPSPAVAAIGRDAAPAASAAACCGKALSRKASREDAAGGPPPPRTSGNSRAARGCATAKPRRSRTRGLAAA